MQVYVAIFSHKFGEDVSVYRTSEGAEKWRITLADDYWHDAFGMDYEKPKDEEKMAQMYWDAMRDNGEEWFSIQACQIED